MNEQQWTFDDQCLLDRLVDGELSPAEMRQAILWLEETPARWRRCGQAFLESQAWSRECRALTGERHPALQPVQMSKPIVPPHRRKHALWPLAMAATLLLAFAMGVGSREAASAIVSALNWNSAEEPSKNSNSGATDTKARPPAIDGLDSPYTATVLLTVDDGEQGKTNVQLPLQPAESLDEILSNIENTKMPEFLSAEVLQSIAAQGHQVVRRRQLWPLQLSDGRTAVVPVEDIRIQAVSQKL